MKKLIVFLKKLRLREIVTVFIAGLLLIISTACSGSATQSNLGANPNNPPVQAGGMNNPYKNGGDSYTNLRMSTDPKVNQAKNNPKDDRASLKINLDRLLAAANEKSKALYPGAETPEGRAYKEAELPIKTAKDLEQPEPGGLIQREPDLGTRAAERLEAVKDTFKEASGFLQDKADEAAARPELQKNPALGK